MANLRSGNSFTTRIDTIPWSPYLDEYLESIKHSCDQAGGDVLIILIKVQRIIDEANQYLRAGMACGRRRDGKPSSSLHQVDLLQRLESIRGDIEKQRLMNSMLKDSRLGCNS